ncbi:hypothetical protein [Methanobrevibacter smithii]|uniref:hypothetical protein n=1 Tax=Methanobrevibacter smithii TaxID=2173 RepID=UPI0037DCA9CE
MVVIKYVRCDKEFIKNMPAKILAELIILEEPILGDLESALLGNNNTFNKERRDFVGRRDDLLKQIWEINYKKEQMNIDDYLKFEVAEDIQFVKKYPQFKPLINHIEYWDNEAEVIIKEVPLDEYLLEN